MSNRNDEPSDHRIMPIAERELRNDAVMFRVPTRRERFWRWLGYRFHLGDEPPQDKVDAASGWMRTDTVFQFSIADRLRLLLTGRLRISVTQYTNCRVDWSANRVDFYIYHPGEKTEQPAMLSWDQ